MKQIETKKGKDVFYAQLGQLAIFSSKSLQYRYEGEVNDKKESHGIGIFRNNIYCYEGEFQNDLFNGKGILNMYNQGKCYG